MFRYYYNTTGEIVRKITYSGKICPVISTHDYIDTNVNLNCDIYCVDPITRTIKPKIPE